MTEPKKITLSLPEGNEYIQIGGDVESLRRDRRMAMSLRRIDSSFDPKTLRIAVADRDVTDLLRALNDALSKRGYEESDDEAAGSALKKFYDEQKAFAEFSEKARRIRNNDCDAKDFEAFTQSLRENIPGRQLYPLQLLSAYHLAFSQNAANFSVPGAGKTTIAYGSYAFLKNLSENNPKHVSALVVVGPLSSFQPWEDEFEACFGKKPSVARLDGTMGLSEKRNYLLAGKPADLTLVSYGSLDPLKHYIAAFLDKTVSMLVLDEAHKIKNTSGGTWATAALFLASHANSRVVLTGTPAPNGYEDLYNLFEFIWPRRNVSNFQVNQLADMSRSEDDERIPRLLANIEPYYLRIRKSDLHLPPVDSKPLQLVEMSPLHRKIYDKLEYLYVEGLIGSNLDDERTRSSAFAKIIRLMQAASNPVVLLKAHANPDAELSLPNDLVELIRLFDKTEVPAKFEAAKNIVERSLAGGEKIIVWTHFVSTLETMESYLERAGIKAKTLFGGTPTGEYREEDEETLHTREAIIKEFNDPRSALRVVIANPAAVAESISLHHSCHTALYLERGFNAAQYLQSRDRIHRYGLGEGIVTTYYKLACRDTIDEVVDERLNLKEERMMRVVESSTIPLFDNALDDYSAEDIKALIRAYVRRTNSI